MFCFLLPKALCADLKGIIAKFWWQKGRNRKGIHWCAWKDLCLLKEDGGLGFRDLAKFNVALLAKQGWRLVNYPTSLLARVLKAKYYPNSNFYKARLGNLPSLTWKSVWSARGLLETGLCWRVGIGDQISVWDDLWISGNEEDRVPNRDNNEDIKLVSDLIEVNNRSWKKKAVRNTFRMHIAEKILRIPLVEAAHEDFQVWRGELTGEFSVRNAYKLLHETNLDPNTFNLHAKNENFYSKLWKLYILSKIQITVWRLSWNFFPSLVNLRLNRVVVKAQCPRCRQEEENSIHIFQQCPTSVEAWEHRNQLLYERRYMSGTEIARQTRNYIADLDAIKERKLTLQSTGNTQYVCRGGRVAIHFDAAFYRQSSRSATILLIRNEGEILASQAVIHSEISTSFMAEAYARLQAVNLGIFMGLNKIEIVGDSKTVIKKCQNTGTDKSVIGAIVRDIQSRKDRFQEIEFYFVPKPKNVDAHVIT
ncbi:hypothetical protein PVK06_030697 [Gossypium arboreum]|uniref:Reverse transcriptase n=1 Tax=Gossypium arboreum TaxID=29729 RepID=A0ABR0NNZ9_GOSAR|nr:hypothetical protein PVK06_030697 [Gossypium arboreum]